MKKFFLTIIFLISFCQVGYCTLSQYTVWEVRTSGASTNGGGFNSSQTNAGTDYSQQDSAQLSLTDLAMTTGGTTLTSSIGGFTAAMVGNIIQISSGTNFTAGFYEITAYTDTNTVTLDRDATNGSNGSSGVGAIGGAVDHPDTISSALVNDNSVYVKSGNYQPVGENDYVLSLAGLGSMRIIFIGYDTSRTATPTGSNRPVFDANSSVSNALKLNGERYAFKNFIFQNATGDGVSGVNKKHYYVNCRSTGNGGKGFSAATDQFFVNVEADSNTGDGIGTSYGTTTVLNSYIHDNGGDGFGDVGAPLILINSIVDTNSAKGIYGNWVNANVLVINSIFYNNTGDSIWQNGNGSQVWNAVYNTSFHTNASAYYIWNETGARIADALNNNYYNNTAITVGNSFAANAYSIGVINNEFIAEGQVTSDPSFTTPASGDFTVSSGSSLIDAGTDISDFTSITTPFSVNIGLDQGDYVVSGGGTTSYGFSN